jgi:putative membrane protein
MTERAAATNVATELAKERNRAAADRTLMAWIRTALSLIGFGFGFGIGKLHAYLEQSGQPPSLDPIRSSLIFGESFIFLGMIGLLAAVVQHVRILNRLARPDFAYTAMRPIAVTVAGALIAIGIFGFIAILL